jgi:hypothetical protein
VSSFLLDENVDPAFQEPLQRNTPGLGVYYIGDGYAPPLSTLDPEILIWIEGHDCMLLTYNRSSMPVHLREHLAAGRHVPGIVQLDQQMSSGDIIEDLLLIQGAGLPGEFADRIIYLPLRR